MSRIRKYRAWDIDNKKMHYFDSNGVMGGDWFIDFFGQVWERHDDTGGDFIVEGIELMDFIGLYDKNEKEVFENDILSDGQDNFLIWIEEGKMLMGGLNREWDIHINPNLISELEIIGNIYENSKLLNITP